MQYIFLLITLLVSVAQTIITKQYAVKSNRPNQILYSAVSALFALIFFIITSGGGLQFSFEFVPYSIGFAITFAAAIAGVNLALATGPLCITSLVSSYSLLVPTLFGIIFLRESLSSLAYIGIVLLLISLYFINVRKEAVKFSMKWIIYLIIGFIGNGMCSTIQKIQQIKFQGAYKNEFMIVALVFVFIMLTIIAVFQKGNLKLELKECFKYAPYTGLANGATNLLVMILTGLLPTAILFPSISAGGNSIMFFVALFVYKERLSRKQIFGYIVGVLSIVLLNI